MLFASAIVMMTQLLRCQCIAFRRQTMVRVHYLNLSGIEVSMLAFLAVRGRCCVRELPRRNLTRLQTHVCRQLPQQPQKSILCSRSPCKQQMDKPVTLHR